MENNTIVKSDHGDEISPCLYLIILVVSVCVIILGIGANCFVVISFCKMKHLRTVTNYFIFQLSIADIFLLMSLAIWMCFSQLSTNEEDKYATKVILASIEVFSSSASLASLACVSVDRCLAVTVPLRYQSITTHSRALVVIISVWIYSIITFITSYLRDVITNELYEKVFIGCLFSLTFLFPIIITTWSYFQIFRAVWRQVHHVVKHTTSNRRMCTVMKEFRMAVNFLVILYPHTYCGKFWLATVTEVLLERHPEYPKVINWLLGITPHFAAALNPFLYITMTRDFRVFFLRLVSCKKLPRDLTFDVGSKRKCSLSMRSSLISTRSSSVSTRSCSITHGIPINDMVIAEDFVKMF
ncbi:LOW QUALITY PROTEIN: histamine H2 receptor-like [Xenia sp. Carnegie-2017]|uniref:LOW QUALITY PROTEIN: histamine H2 receptor-like n=1 Tax=Xenia sp. Carnegie-2017 TaxID=2897299 RepID=UPI001F03DE4D|nr:LOW QUALITY PROTEIN: histamine H2 receptor-like [Xenia sp. Carnegie-2017]